MKVLFVCSGNVFRSMSAEYCLRDLFKKKKIKGIANSAGIYAYPQDIDPVTLETLKGFGIDTSKHKLTRLSEEHFKKFDLVVAMADYHQEYIKENFEKDAPLFNEICHGKKTCVYDISDVVHDWKNNRKAVEKHLRDTVTYIHDSMPLFVKNMKKFI